VRGGSWAYWASWARAAWRSYLDPSLIAGPWLGFRCARSVSEP